MVADVKKQQAKDVQGGATSPTVTFTTTATDVYKWRNVVTVDFPNAYLFGEIGELVHMEQKGMLAERAVKIKPQQYRAFVTENIKGGNYCMWSGTTHYIEC